MKPQPVDLAGSVKRRDVIDRIVATRYGEATTHSSALEDRERGKLHDFRIACKRLRYACERFCRHVPELEAGAEALAAIQDALGEAHDRDVLLSILPPTLPLTQARLIAERARYVGEASERWQRFEGSFEKNS